MCCLHPCLLACGFLLRCLHGPDVAFLCSLSPPTVLPGLCIASPACVCACMCVLVSCLRWKQNGQKKGTFFNKREIQSWKEAVLSRTVSKLHFWPAQDFQSFDDSPTFVSELKRSSGCLNVALGCVASASVYPLPGVRTYTHLSLEAAATCPYTGVVKRHSWKH